MPNKLYYVIGSYQKGKRIFFQSQFFLNRNAVREFYENFRKNYPSRKPHLLKIFEIKGEGKEFLRNWNRADELYSMLCEGKISVKELPDLL